MSRLNLYIEKDLIIAHHRIQHLLSRSAFDMSFLVAKLIIVILSSARFAIKMIAINISNIKFAHKEHIKMTTDFTSCRL